MSKRERKVVLQDVELTSNTPDEGEPKSWGFVAAKPSEYLVVYRKGRLAERLCGQGARFFKWPSDGYAVIPTTLKEVMFQANQITRDNVDVRLRGMLVYRITDPLRIYKLINFSRRARAEAKLARMIADMCRSTAKWLVANMDLEECNRRRKEEIAGALKQEVAAVATEGWGVEIVTIDIQDVYVQDDELFRAMQAAFKADQERSAQLAQIRLERTLAERRLADERELARQRHELEQERAEREAEARRLEAERAAADAQAEARRSAALRLSELEQTRRHDEEKFALDRFRVEQNDAILRRKLEEEQERERLAAEGRRERARIDAEAERIGEEAALLSLRERLAAESGAGRASLERLFIREALPALSEALARSLEGARFHVYQSGEGKQAAGPLPFALAQTFELLQQRLAGVPAGSNGAG